MEFIEARHYYKGRKGQKPIWIVLHVMVAPEKGSTAENAARAASKWDRKASWHIGVDNDSAVMSVRDEDTAFAAAGANTLGWHIEHAGYPQQSGAEWRDPFSDAMLARSALEAAKRVEKWNIPIQFCNAQALKKRVSGFTTHAEVEKAFPSTGHWDPGPNFPLSYYLQLVEASPLLHRPTEAIIMNNCVAARKCPVDGGYQRLQADGGIFNTPGCNHFFGSYPQLMAKNPSTFPPRTFVAIEDSTDGSDSPRYIIFASDGSFYQDF